MAHTPVRRKASLEQRDGRLGLVLILPALILFLALIVYPMANGVWIGFTKTHTVTRVSEFVGLANYVSLFAAREFWVSLGNTAIWTVSSVVLQVVIGVGVAMLLHQNFVLRSLARALVLFPYLLPIVVAVLVWQWLFNDLYGFINYALLELGLIARPLDWLGVMPNAMISIVLIGAWKYFPFVVIAVLARLQSIPEPLYESATLDGAGAWAQFWDITIPQLRGVLFIVILLRAIWDFKEFDLIFLATGGGPVIATQTLPLLVYKEAFQLFRMGMASAIAVAMFAVMVTFMVFYFRRFARDDE